MQIHLSNRIPRSEIDIVKDWHEPHGTPLISICCATYNHKDYIEDAILGFLKQECTAKFEIIIRDDASNDGTSSIVKHYANRYPKVIRPIINGNNLFNCGEKPHDAWKKLARGKYIAICEGDDYWISKDKIQIQFDFLETHPEYGLCCHPALTSQTEVEALGNKPRSSEIHSGKTVQLQDILDFNFVFTNSVMVRSDYLHEMQPHGLYMGDWPLWTFVISKSKAFHHDNIYGFYRKHNNGLWSSLSNADAFRHKLDFYDYIEDSMPHLSKMVRGSRRKHLEILLESHQIYIDKVMLLKKKPFLFVSKWLFSKLSHPRNR